MALVAVDKSGVVVAVSTIDMVADRGTGFVANPVDDWYLTHAPIGDGRRVMASSVITPWGEGHVSAHPHSPTRTASARFNPVMTNASHDVWTDRDPVEGGEKNVRRDLPLASGLYPRLMSLAVGEPAPAWLLDALALAHV